ncbi:MULTISPECIES: A/G-specific adenine glycosylase [unclassified Nitratiruptor]|uniref:A/G-specific adenine glycosylase n=1 Tax=unclassified Nitratiruptor TaxID=2624044 RepID=UPI001915D047|nr:MULTISPECIES: A/G-specific adenine glycosylase [unclassified Nitratiruptor]BCD59466.1 A/G-specific adenine glycosylase [Nitratiruptor sp. YY08-10]BCD63390.1 A/G-specific adenine glycosylase [Nitratiruptor sp. YY08-14]
MHKVLLEWFEKHGRHELPWRQTQDVYKIYLSEIMLQQTQVSRVESEYYPKFLKRFPTLKDLAQASENEVLALWSGLGYYSRARNLLQCAKICQDALPKEPRALMKLPGIGTYTANAICAFAYNQPVAVVDTNIKRVLMRFFALKNEKEVHQKAQMLLNTEVPKEHNLALMDLGSLICTPKNPRCNQCPLQQWCLGKETPHAFGKGKAVKREEKVIHFGIFVQKGHIALQRSTQNLYKNMWILPTIESAKHPFATFRHSYTKYNIQATLTFLNQKPPNTHLIPLQELSTYPVASIAQKGIKKAIKFLQADL